MTYCPNCGAAVDGRFCPKCGAPAPAAGAPPGAPQYVPPPASAQGLGMEENLAAALCYIPIIGIIFLLIDPYKQNRTIRFHAWQSIFFSVAWFVVRIAMAILWMVLRVALPYGMWAMWALLSSLISLAFLGLLIFMAVKAYQRDRLVLPVITALAEKQV